MPAIENKKEFLDFWNNHLTDLLQMRKLPEDDMAYLMTKVNAMKDERLKSCVAGLIGWGDKEDAEIQTFCAVALQIMADARPSVFREAQRKVELRSLMNKADRVIVDTPHPIITNQEGT